VHVTAIDGRLDPVAVADLAGRYGCADVDQLGPQTALLTFSSCRTAQDLLRAASSGHHNEGQFPYRVEKYSVTRHCTWLRRLLWAGLSLSLVGLSATVIAEFPRPTTALKSAL
jgi:hypothetical protein